MTTLEIAKYIAVAMARRGIDNAQDNFGRAYIVALRLESNYPEVPAVEMRKLASTAACNEVGMELRKRGAKKRTPQHCEGDVFTKPEYFAPPPGVLVIDSETARATFHPGNIALPVTRIMIDGRWLV